MNKKFLSAVLFGALMVGSSVTFTGCIDNDEPAGIETLRGAKAELLNAKAAVEKAKIAWVEADAAYRAAEAREKEAEAAKAEVAAKQAELQYVIDQAESEATIQAAKNALEQAKHDLELAQLQWEQELLEQKTMLAEAQKDYDDAMKALELSKTYLSDDELEILGKVETQYDIAKARLDGANGILNAAYDTYKDAVTNAENYLNEATLTEAVSVAESNVAKATNKLNLRLEALNALESDDKYVAWQEVRKDFQHKLDSVAIVIADKKDQKDKLVAYENNHSIKGLNTAITNVEGIKPGKVASSNPKAFEVSTAIQSYIALTTDADPAILEYAGGKLTVKNFNTAIVGGYKDKDGKGSKGNYEGMLKYNFVFNGGNGYDKTSKAIAGAIKDVTAAKNNVDPNIPAWAEDNLKLAKDAMDAAKKTSDTALESWKKAVASLGTEYDVAAFNDDAAILLAQENTAKGATAGTTDGDALIAKALGTYKVTYAKMISYDQTIAAADKAAIDNAIKNVTDFKAAADASRLSGKFTHKPFSSQAALEAAAKSAFGNAFKDIEGNVYRIMPTDEYVLDNDDAVPSGAYTLYLKSVITYNEAKEKVELNKQFDAVLAELNAWAKTLSDAKDAYEEANKATLDALTAAQNTVKEKVVTPIAALKLTADEAYEKDINDMLTAVTNNEDVKQFEQLISTLKAEVGDKKGVAGATASTGLYADVEAAEKDLLNAEKTLELFKEGNLKEQYIIDYEKNKLELAKADYNKALEVFNYWSDKLAATMQTLYGKASAE